MCIRDSKKATRAYPHTARPWKLQTPKVTSYRRLFGQWMTLLLGTLPVHLTNFKQSLQCGYCPAILPAHPDFEYRHSVKAATHLNTGYTELYYSPAALNIC